MGITPRQYDTSVEECVDKVKALRSFLPREREPFELFLLEWARFKRKLAEIAALCLAKLLPNAVREVYYMELADDGIGRDVDLFIVVDERRVHDTEEVATMFESILAKLVELSGLEAQKYTTAPSLFEVHISTGRLYGSRSLLSNAVRIYPPK